jgi:hypothetical protein
MHCAITTKPMKKPISAGASRIHAPTTLVLMIARPASADAPMPSRPPNKQPNESTLPTIESLMIAVMPCEPIRRTVSLAAPQYDLPQIATTTNAYLLNMRTSVSMHASKQSIRQISR